MRAIATFGLLLALAAIAGCGGDSRFFDTDSDKRSDENRKAIQAEIADLKYGKDPKDVDKDLRYDAAKDKLLHRGSRIEPQLIEALGGADDWAVRMGVIEVLESVGTRGCVDAVVRATADQHPLVSLRANKLLEVMCHHREIPAAGEAIGANNLPPVAVPPTADLALDAQEKAWSAWHREHREALHKAWSAWWAANKNQTKID